MSEVYVVFPHQLFKDTSHIPHNAEVVLVEEYLFFRQYKFHKLKLAFHRSAMQYYHKYLQDRGYRTFYIGAFDSGADIRDLPGILANRGIRLIGYSDPTDDWLEKRLRKSCENAGIKLKRDESRLFLTSRTDYELYYKGRKRYFQTDFYIWQRQRFGIMTDSQRKPIGGHWSYDADNRQKFPKKQAVPVLPNLNTSEYFTEALEYVYSYFPDNPGELSSSFRYPVTHEESEIWLDDFLAHRFAAFGPYEDAIVEHENVLHHSVLSPLLNTGLLLPNQVIDRALDWAAGHHIPLNSMEGFVRQILGWREFVRVVYEREGTRQRTTNFWGFTRKIPQSFYTATTGIRPVDSIIKKTLSTAYNHHIERLMVLSNFMLLCEFHPNDVYRWFLEMYIDAYDWVMVPNVYGMGQFADGGLMCTKPYISGSNYLLKMSDFPKGTWTETWDALFWRFMHVHRDYFIKNPRSAMLLKTLDAMPAEKRTKLLDTAEQFLAQLDNNVATLPR